MRGCGSEEGEKTPRDSEGGSGEEGRGALRVARFLYTRAEREEEASLALTEAARRRPVVKEVEEGEED